MEEHTDAPAVSLVLIIADTPGDERILQALLEAHYGVTALPSVGGFTGQASRTVLCAIPKAEVENTFALLRSLSAPALAVVLSAERFERVGEGVPAG
jgi:uncharacterized protein YaaQ